MKRVTIERRIRHLQREMVKLSMSADPRRGRILQTLLRSIAIERRQLSMMKV